MADFNYLKQENVTATAQVTHKDHGKQNMYSVLYSYDKNISKLIIPIIVAGDQELDFTAIKRVRILLTFNHEGIQKSIEDVGKIESPENKTLSYIVTDKLKGYEGNVALNIYLDLTTDQQIDLAEYGFAMKRSTIDQNIPEIEQFYFKSLDDVIIELQRKSAEMLDKVTADSTSAAKKVKEIEEQIAKQNIVKQETFAKHDNDNIRHVTKVEKARWDAKVTPEAIENLGIRNLFKGYPTNEKLKVAKTNGYYYEHNFKGLGTRINLDPNTEYTFSWSSETISGDAGVVSAGYGNETYNFAAEIKQTQTKDGVLTFKTPAQLPHPYFGLRLVRSASPASGTVDFWDLCLRKGAIKMEWTAAAEDVVNRADQFKPTEIVVPTAGADDLNNYTNAGYYVCRTNPYAVNLLNTPVNIAFNLEVQELISANKTPGVNQLLTTYHTSNTAFRRFSRNLYNGTWSMWREIPFLDQVQSYDFAEIKGQDWNTLKTSSIYWSAGATGANRPTALAAYGYLEVFNSVGAVIQRYTSSNTEVATRYYSPSANSWSGWVVSALTNQVQMSKITGDDGGVYKGITSGTILATVLANKKGLRNYHAYGSVTDLPSSSVYRFIANMTSDTHGNVSGMDDLGNYYARAIANSGWVGEWKKL
ncbi:BppU family phage baseplate upper protein [Enterococcus rotai]|uniref:BppU family phage baseplate upper protein n=1 Tax=Enterococcus rotai TaxID=118060 RepID=UPI0032B59E13